MFLFQAYSLKIFVSNFKNKCIKTIFIMDMFDLFKNETIIFVICLTKMTINSLAEVISRLREARHLLFYINAFGIYLHKGNCEILGF